MIFLPLGGIMANKVLFLIDGGFYSKVKQFFLGGNRVSPFSRCNELIKSVDKYVKFSKEDFLEVEQ